VLLRIGGNGGLVILLRHVRHITGEDFVRLGPSRHAVVTRYTVAPLVATAGLLGVVALVLGIAEGYLAVVMIASVIVFVGSFHYGLRGGRAFAFALANLIGTYACIFLFFVESNFARVSVVILSVGFLMPLVAFLLGSLRRRREIHGLILAGRRRQEAELAHVLLWLVPVFVIGAATFLVPQPAAGAGIEAAVFTGAMLAISLIVFIVSHDVAIFLLDTGLLFEAFFERMRRLVIPAFAFLTFYSLLVMLFASFYTIMDHVGSVPNFRIDGVIRPLTFPESLYFSVTTLSTVGYGDISPATNLVRFITALEIVCGVLLLLFGFNEIFSFAQGQARRHHKAD
jgi:voltage-gated potassium channel